MFSFYSNVRIFQAYTPAYAGYNIHYLESIYDEVLVLPVLLYPICLHMSTLIGSHTDTSSPRVRSDPRLATRTNKNVTSKGRTNISRSSYRDSGNRRMPGLFIIETLVFTKFFWRKKKITFFQKINFSFWVFFILIGAGRASLALNPNICNQQIFCVRQSMHHSGTNSINAENFCKLAILQLQLALKLWTN